MTRITNSPLHLPTAHNLSKPIVFMQHGMFCSSDSWIILSPQKGLAYMLADAGYDVWLGNSRGNRYSKAHRNLSIDSSEFWQFSFHEVGIYDIPAMLDYVLEKTSQNSLHFVGDSQGSTGFIVMLAERPEYNGKIRSSHHLSPVVFVDNIRTPFTLFAKFGSDHALLGSLIRNREYMSSSLWWVSVCNRTCPEDSLLFPLCNVGLSLTGGDWHLNKVRKNYLIN